MKQRASGGTRRATSGGTDGSSLEATLVASSLLLWLPYSLAAIYVAYCGSFLTQVPLATAAPAAMAAAATASSGGAAAASVVTMGVASASSEELRRYSAVYYYIFPADFDIAVFVPLLMRVLAFSVVAISVTYYLSVHRHNGGEYLMAVAWALGTFSEYGWLTSSTGAVQQPPGAGAAGGSAKTLFVSATPPSWLWLAVSLLTGLFSGILCKVKDIVDGKHDRDTHLFHMFDRSHSTGRGGQRAGRHGTALPASDRVDSVSRDGGAESLAAASSAAAVARRRQRQAYAANAQHLVSLGDRLYMVVPFCTGQWFAFILHHGWRGIIVENGTILLSLGLVGYAMLSYKFLKRQVLRASGRVSRSVAARGRSRRNERRLKKQQEQQQQLQQHAGSPVTSAEGSSLDVSSASASTVTPGSAASDEELEEEASDFFEDVGEVAFIDVIDLISKLFTTSFGVVVLCVVGLNIFMTTLCIPFLKALFKLNALVSGVGIVIDLIMYEVA